MGAAMHLPEPRGPVTAALCADLTPGTLAAATVELAERTAATATDPLRDEDLQLALAICYELHYRGFAGVAETWEWDPELLRDRKSTRLNSSHANISYAVFCLKKKKKSKSN